MNKRLSLLATAACLLLSACGSSPQRSTEPQIKPATKPASPAPRGGGYYKDDGPADDIPPNLDDIPDAVPRWEPLHRPALRPYEVFGKRYVPKTAIGPHRQRGIASWYGKKFHGQKTSMGETYDMFAMSAAHPTLPLPSYVRVRNVKNDRTVVVRVNDRGPFHAGRIIDLSYTAAHRLGIVQGGSAEVEIEAIIPGQASSTTYAEVSPAVVPAAAPSVAPQVETRLPAGIYLQVGAFANAVNADNFKEHLVRELDWMNTPVHLQQAGALHRVRIGPFASRVDAEQTADRIHGSLGYRPNIVSN